MESEKKRIFREMAPYFLHVIWPILIIIIIAKVFGPSF
jgi:hypothetical protein